jgi:hypothetical protein
MSNITRETFITMDTDSKLCVLFDYVHDIQKSNKIHKVINTTASLMGGFIGGWSAVWTAFKFQIFGG